MDWHRLFGIFLWDYFLNSPFEVELEKDLSLKRQLLDVVILRKHKEGSIGPLPDGMENLKNHNLLSYKSLREPLDDWAMKELIGHYVNYRKQVSPSLDVLLPEEEFQLYGVCTRFPQKLAGQTTLHPMRQGVYEVRWGGAAIRVIVLSEIPNAEHNALWRLFSGNPEAVRYGAEHYQFRTSTMSTAINQLFTNYQMEGVMSYTIDDFQKDYLRDHLNVLSLEDRLKGLSHDEVLKRYSPEEVLKRYSPDDRLKGLSHDEVLKHYSLEEIKAFLEKAEKKRE